MSFPTSDMTQGFANWLQLSRIRGLVLASRPDLERAFRGYDDERVLTIELPSGSGAGLRVALAPSKSRQIFHWLLVAPHKKGALTFAWERHTKPEHLSDAVVAVYDACVTGSAVPTPWRWGQPVRLPIVQVADKLGEAGIEVGGVVSSANRLIVDADKEGAIRVPESFGDALRINTDFGTATLAIKPTLGWVLDASDGIVTRRLALSPHVSGQPSSPLGFHTEDLDELARAISMALGDKGWRGSADQPDDAASLRSGFPLHHAAVTRLRELGYQGAEFQEIPRPHVVSTEHVVVASKRCNLKDVKSEFAEAVVEGKSLVVFATDGFTRDAVHWADDKAGVPLFMLDARSFRLSAASSRARELLPQVI